MRVFFLLAAFYVGLIIYGGVSAAQEESMDAETPIAVQTQKWSIFGLDGVQKVSQTPENCAMTAEYDNDVRITFKATGRKLTALRIESIGPGQDVGQFLGFVGLGVGKNSYALQSNLKGNQLDASLLSVPKIVEKLQDATVFRLKLGTQNTYYALQGFDEAYNNLMVCVGIAPRKTLKVVDHSKGKPRQNDAATPVVASVNDTQDTLLPKVEDSEMPASPVVAVDDGALDDDLSDIETVEFENQEPTNLLPSAEKDDADQVASSDDQGDDIEMAHNDKATADVKLPEWRAMKGQRLSEVLKTWSSKQGVKAHVVLDNDPVLSKDIVSNGSFEMAVNSLLSETGQSGFTSALVKNAKGRVTHVAGNQTAVLGSQAQRHYKGAPLTRLRALQGTDLRNVLRQWAAKNNVEFVWNAPQRFMVRQSVKTTVSFEEAVSTLLNQYQGQSTRPIAQLNKDPDTGVKTLIISVHMDDNKTAQ